MRPALLASAMAFYALITTTAAHAATARFEFVNDRGEAVQVEPADPGCVPSGRTTLATGSSLVVDCSIDVNKHTGVRVRGSGRAGAICYPLVVMASEHRIEIASVGANSCNISTIGRLSYRVYLREINSP